MMFSSSINVLPDTSRLFQLQQPRDLLATVTSIADDVSDEDLMNRAGEFYQKTKEALVASTFAAIFAHTVKPTLVKMVHERMLDFKLSDFDGQTYDYEIVMALEPRRKPGLEYRDGRKPIPPLRAFSGKPVPAEWIVKVIQKKTELAKKNNFHHRHLLVYQNIPGGTPDLRQLKALVGDANSVWASVWLISGVPDWGGVALLSNRHGFSWPEMEWLSYVNAPKGEAFSGFYFYLQ